MNEVIEQDSRYPEWMKAWNAKVAEIDQQIIDFFQGKDRTPDNIRTLRGEIRRWWETQPLDEKARHEYLEGSSDDNYFGGKVENRVRQLEQEGRFGQSTQSGRAAGGAG
jgi:hypothetical protein